MPATPIKDFTGINNQSPEFNVELNASLEVTNFDIDDDGRGKTRDGYVLRAAGDFHSIWSDLNRQNTYLVDGVNIQKVLPLFTFQTVVSGLTSANKMTFVETVRDTIVYSNGVDIGRIVNNSDEPFAIPLDSIKMSPVPCKILKWFSGRLYMVDKDILWFTDAYTYNVDTTDGLFLFSSDITMVEAVNDGLYVSDQERTYFVKNDPPSKVLVSDYPAIEKSSQSVHSELLNLQEIPPGLTAIWSSLEGVVVGGDGGVTVNLTRDNYVLPLALLGSSVIRKDSGSYKYIVNLFN